MIKEIQMEFFKLQRKKLWVVIIAMAAVEILWSLWSFRRMGSRELKQGWMICLYQFPLLNAIIMPVTVAVIASRLCDMENKGSTLKVLKTLMPMKRLFGAKLICGSVYILVLTLLQVIELITIGKSKGFDGNIPLLNFLYYFLFTYSVSLTIYVLQQTLSLVFSNQMVALSIGLIGSFAGLFTMFFPQAVERFVLWGYYGVLMQVKMDWNEMTRVCNYSWQPIDWSGFIILIFIFCAIYLTGRMFFVRKEL